MKKRDYKLLLVVTEVYRQQLWMYQNNKQSIEDRIVSLTQPHIRPIVRGKAGKPGEFGAKFSASCIDGYIGSAEKVFPGGRSQESGVSGFVAIVFCTKLCTTRRIMQGF